MRSERRRQGPNARKGAVVRTRGLFVRSALLLAAVAILAAGAGDAKTHWASGRVVNGQYVPNSSDFVPEPAPGEKAGPVLLDIVVSVHGDPAGDNDGSTQGVAGSEEQDKYERIFQRMADAIYEASDAGHKLRKVRIYKKGAFKSASDIYWAASGWPCANVNGIANPGKHIYMFDIFAYTGGTHDLLNDPKGAGYTCAHEWGHYGYGLYDEYAINPGDVPVSPAIMNRQWNATGGDYKWLNHSIADNPDAGTDYENTKKTAQHREHGMSCWETLASPITLAQQFTAWLLSKPGRTYYPELAAVAPTGANEPTIQLPTADARSSLDIIWMGGNLVYDIVIDHSGSMGSTTMSNAKTAAKLLVDMAQEGTTTLGVTKFDDAVTQVYPMTLIQDQATKDAIKAQIDTIFSDGLTAIGDAANVALAKVVGAGTASDSKVVFLLTDGHSNTGVPPLSVIPAYQAVQIPIMAFAYGSGADVNTLRQMAEQTGGNLYIAPTTLAAITQAFQDANAAVSSSTPVGSTGGTVATGTATDYPFFVDDTLVRFDATVTYQGNAAMANVKLIDPVGGDFAANTTTESGGETIRYFSVNNPMSGQWIVQVEANFSDLDVSVESSGVPDQTSFYCSVGSTAGSTVNYPNPVIVTATLEGNLAITGATVTASVSPPSGDDFEITLNDAGDPPDDEPGDGTYSGSFLPTQNGQYDVEVQANNNAGTAVLTYEGVVFTANPNGQGPTGPMTMPVGGNFQRSGRTQITVQGVIPDDHGDTPAAATGILNDNTPTAGRIDYGGDPDVFSAMIPVAATGMTFRASAFAVGMDPAMRVFAPDGVTVLAQGTLATNPTVAGYLALAVGGLNAGDQVFCEITHTDQAAGTGTYQVSAGAAVPTDAPGVPQAGAVQAAATPDEDEKDRWYEFCFVATAAYGSPMAEQVDALRSWRDSELTESAAGRVFVDAYYTYGPYAAQAIEGNEQARAVTRLLLRPVVTWAEGVETR